MIFFFRKKVNPPPSTSFTHFSWILAKNERNVLKMRVQSVYDVDADYDLIPVPGEENLHIAVVPAFYRSQHQDDVGVRYASWTLTADTLFLPKPFEELFGWYAESGRETGTDIGNQLFTGGSLRHSELIVVIPNGKHLATFENKLSNGSPIKTVVITHLSRLGLPQGLPVPIQINTFHNCHVTGVQQYLDALIVRFRIQKKFVECTTFSQEGHPAGVGYYSIDFATHKGP